MARARKKKATKKRAKKATRKRTPKKATKKAGKKRAKKATKKRSSGKRTIALRGGKLTVYKMGTRWRWMLMRDKKITDSGATDSRAEAERDGKKANASRMGPGSARSSQRGASDPKSKPSRQRKRGEPLPRQVDRVMDLDHMTGPFTLTEVGDENLYFTDGRGRRYFFKPGSAARERAFRIRVSQFEDTDVIYTGVKSPRRSAQRGAGDPKPKRSSQPDARPHPGTLVGYYSVIIPYAAKNRTKWHPTNPTGSFSSLSRGSWPTPAGARAWAAKNIPGHRFKVQHYTPDGEVTAGKYETAALRSGQRGAGDPKPKSSRQPKPKFTPTTQQSVAMGNYILWSQRRHKLRGAAARKAWQDSLQRDFMRGGSDWPGPWNLLQQVRNRPGGMEWAYNYGSDAYGKRVAASPVRSIVGVGRRSAQRGAGDPKDPRGSSQRGAGDTLVADAKWSAQMAGKAQATGIISSHQARKPKPKGSSQRGAGDKRTSKQRLSASLRRDV